MINFLSIQLYSLLLIRCSLSLNIKSSIEKIVHNSKKKKKKNGSFECLHSNIAKIFLINMFMFYIFINVISYNCKITDEQIRLIYFYHIENK